MDGFYKRKFTGIQRESVPIFDDPFLHFSEGIQQGQKSGQWIPSCLQYAVGPPVLPSTFECKQRAASHGLGRAWPA